MTAETSSAPGQWDHVAKQLQEWRHAADEPSYSEIALSISRRREEAGAEPAAARVGRTTVYDAFRLGRSRVHLGLVREIALALGVESEAVRELFEKPQEVPAEPTESTGGDGLRSSIAIMIGCLALNLLGREFVDVLGVPIYLDMVGTALAAIVLGPWRGAAVGASTNLLGVFISGYVSLPFAVVNVVGALMWGYGVHRFGLGRTLPRYFALSLAVAVACTLTAVPILHFLYHGSAGHQQEHLSANLLELSQQYAVALWGGNLLASVADKTISAFVALVGATLLGHSLAGFVVHSDESRPQSHEPGDVSPRRRAPRRHGARTP